MGNWLRQRFKKGSVGGALTATLLMTGAVGVDLASLSPSAWAQTLDQTRFSVPAGPLNQALTAFGRQAGLQVSYLTSIVAGKTSRGVSGLASNQEALASILQGSGLTYSFPNSTTVSILQTEAMNGNTAADGSIILETITIQGQGNAAQMLQGEGTARDGYRSSTVSSLGPLGGIPLKDTPYSISVVPRELLQNIQAQSPDDVFRINPSTRTQTPQVTGWSPMVTIRGFNTYDTAEDGLRRSFSHASSLEDKERVEVLNGLSGFLYGASAPAGMINYVYKRPTIERLNSISVGTYGAEQKYVHGDFGGRIDEEGRAGYRLNVVKQDGSTSIDDQSINRLLVSGAFDWQVTDRLNLELNASYTKYEMDSPSAYWTFRPGILHGNAPDASKNWSQPWIRDEIEKKRFSGKLTYELNDSITLRGAYMREYIDRPIQDHTMNSVRAPGEYYQIAIHSGKTKNIYDAAQILADISFDTGPVSHKMTMGYYMYSDKSWGTSYNPNTGYIGPYPMSDPLHVPKPTFPVDTSSPYYSGTVRNHNFVIGDQIEFNDRWSALVGVNYSQIVTKSLDESGARAQPDYDEGRLSPSVSLMYKPLPWMTIYASYVEGLEQGGVAPDTASNYGAIMAPMVSKQKEIGIKAELGGVLLTGALFEIEKAYEFTNSDGIYTQEGRQNHRGVEFTATGKPIDSLTVIGGVTLLDASVEGGDFDGNTPMNVAKVLAKLYAEYEVPSVEGLFLTGGIYYTGKQWASNANDDRLPSFTTMDLGLRYTTEVSGNPLTLRLSVNNVTNENYWQNSYYLGAPRTVAFSAQMKF